MSNSITGIRIDARMLGHSGIGIVIENIAKRWIRNKPGIKFQILVRNKVEQHEVWMNAANVEVVEWDVPIYSIKEHLIPPKKASFSIDLTWVPHYNVSTVLGTNVLASIHDVFHLDTKAQVRSIAQKIYANLMFRWAKRRAKVIQFGSKFTQDEFVRLIGQPKGRYGVVYYGVDEAWQIPFPPKPSPLSRPYFVFVGNAFPHKNLSRLIEAVKITRSRSGVDIALAIVGKIEGLKNLDKDALEFAKQNLDFVHVIGKVNFDDLLNWICHAKALIFPSLYEGFGLPPLEAIALGTPAAVSNIPVHKEVHSGFVTFFNPQSAENIADALDDILLGNTKFVSREDLLSRYNWEDSALKLFQLAESVVFKV